MLVLFCLWPIWGVRFLPMQDYPQHLFLSYVLATFEDPSFQWDQHYTTAFVLGPYSLYYLTIRVFLFVVDIETAGKLWVSAYFVLIGAYIATEARRRTERSEPLPWGALLMLPLGFNQAYYMGFQNFLLSIPILLFALRAHQDFSLESTGRQPLLMLLVWILLLFLIHPYTLLVFIVLAGTTGLSHFRRACFRRSILVPISVVVVFAGWYFTYGSLQPAHGAHTQWAVLWWPLRDTLAYMALMFTGMQITDGPSWIHLVFWSIASVSLTTAAYRWWTDSTWGLRHIHFALCVCGVLVMPFWMGYFSYFNVRLAAIGYFLGAAILARLQLSRYQATAIVLSAALLILAELPRHQLLSEEIEKVLPALHEMEPNARVFPIYDHTETPYLDKKYFFQFHAHEHFYYHLLIGGGASPKLFLSAMIPLRFSADANLSKSIRRACPNVANYRYILVRDPSGRQVAAKTVVGLILVQSGPWFLLDLNRCPIEDTTK